MMSTASAPPAAKRDQDELAAWLRLALTQHVGPSDKRALLAAFGLPQHIFAAGAAALAGVIPRPQVDELLRQNPQADIERGLAWAATPGNHILTLADAEYPQGLLDTADPPLLLYAKGRVDLLNRTTIGVVGSRNATAQGIVNAESFSETLSQANITVASGLALGIDAAAHRGALRGPGSTIAVIGTGADRMYPAANEALARAIAEGGVIITEFALGTPALPANFPKRNRLISGLSRGVLVVEAALKSGSLITARMAGEQGRDVFAIPGSIHSPLSKGCHHLIKQGAKLVDDAADILDELGLSTARSARKKTPKPATEAETETAANTPENQVLQGLGHDPCDMDTLTQRTGLTPDALYGILISLEFEGRVATLPGGRYQRLP